VARQRRPLLRDEPFQHGPAIGQTVLHREGVDGKHGRAFFGVPR
jgi:hypothetical protein